MKKITFIALCVLLLCGGLFCFHLTAQTERTVSAKPVSLLEQKIEDISEWELLELKVATYQKIVDVVDAHARAGSPRGSSVQIAEAHANLAAAQIELYRHTGEQDKLLAAHQARVKALTEKLRAVTNAHEHTTMTSKEFHEAEIQLLDALLEQKREPFAPQITATNPPNGAKDVDPNITEISVTFDRPMMPGIAWYTRDGGKTFPKRSDDQFPVWSEDKKTSTVKNVVLKPGTTYNVWFNTEVELYSNIPGDGFRSANNIPLKPVHYTFTTKAE